MHCGKHTSNTVHGHNHGHDGKHCPNCNSRHATQSHIVVPPCSPREIITSSGIISLLPSQGPSTGTNPIIINGYNLIFVTSVNMGRINVPFTILSNNQIQIIALPQTTSSTVQITVNFKNDSSESLPYTYVSGTTIAALTPSSGPIIGSNIITITGTGLAFTTSVYFNNIITFNFVITSDSTIQVAVPNLTGQSNILVHVVAGGITSNNLPYSLIPPPII